MAGNYWRRPLDADSRARNRAIAPLRTPVERTFAILERWYRYCRVRYRSWRATGCSCSCCALR